MNSRSALAKEQDLVSEAKMGCEDGSEGELLPR